MPFVLILVGFALVGAVWRGKEDELAEVLKDDFSGSNNFVAWLIALVILGAIGSASETARPLAEAFMLLVIVALVASQDGIWEKFKAQALAP